MNKKMEVTLAGKNQRSKCMMFHCHESMENLHRHPPGSLHLASSAAGRATGSATASPGAAG